MMSSKNKTQYSCSSQKSYKSGKGADCPVNELCCMLTRDLSFKVKSGNFGWHTFSNSGNPDETGFMPVSSGFSLFAL